MEIPTRFSTFVTALCLTLFAQTSGHTTDYYKGKTVTYIVATAPGGGYDIYGRLVSEYLQKHLPGSTFIVRNLPGAGHLVGANTLYASKPDGLTIGTFNTGLIYTQLAEHKGIKFDLREMSWIGKAAADPHILVVSSNSSLRTFSDLENSKEQLNFATAGPGSAGYAEILGLTKILNLPIRLLSGYNGNDDQLAMRRGEIVGTIASRSAFAQFVKNDYGLFLAQFGGKETDLPQMSALAPGEEAQRFIKLVNAVGDIARLTAAPPSVSPGILDILRMAYRRSVQDPQFRATAAKADLPLEPLFGEDVAQAISAALDQPPRVRALVKEAFVINN